MSTKKSYKPKAKNETALKKYIQSATKNSNKGHRRNNNSKQFCNRIYNICRSRNDIKDITTSINYRLYCKQVVHTLQKK